MNAHGSDSEHPDRLAFYCRECDVVFDSAPDDTGYEQAECPKCNEVCMTVAFEQEEHDRHRSEATFFSLLGRVTGLFHLNVDDRQQRRATPEPVTVARYADRPDAEKDADILARRGIEATIELNRVDSPSWFGGTNVPVIELKVPPSDVPGANKILHETAPPLPQGEKPSGSAEDVTFECEECGKTVSFSWQRRGKVETCPHCREYVDVPD